MGIPEYIGYSFTDLNFLKESKDQLELFLRLEVRNNANNNDYVHKTNNFNEPFLYPIFIYYYSSLCS